MGSTDDFLYSDSGHITRMVDTLTLPLREPHSVKQWLLMLGLGLILVFVWTRILGYMTGE